MIQGLTKVNGGNLYGTSLQGYLPKMDTDSFTALCEDYGSHIYKDSTESYKGYDREAEFTVDGMFFTIYNRDGQYRFGAKPENQEKVGQALKSIGITVEYL
jgi:hypothetical protein|tara:strand:+ start:1506 stop:1808 length:303 start_codon:yes stop_codon:yes gene_type:complete